MKEPLDFGLLEKHLIAGCKKAIAIAVKEVKKNDPATFFAIDSNPYYGEFLPSVDTLSTSRVVMRAEQENRLSSRRWMRLEGKDAWLETYDGAYRSSVPMFSADASEFTHHMIHDCKYPPLDALARSKLYKKLNARAGKDGWIEGHVRVALARVCDRLVDGKAFAKLPIALPFGVGYQYHDEKMVVCRVIV